MYILTENQIRMCENTANAEGLSFEEMMQRAGCGCAMHIIKHYPQAKTVTVLCGKGKNGGDGYVIARILAEKGLAVTAVNVFGGKIDSLSEKMKNLLSENVLHLPYPENPEKVNHALEKSEIIIDAVFGIGFKGTLPDRLAELFNFCNGMNVVRISIDVPSGLSADLRTTDLCFAADETLCILQYKRVHAFKPTSDRCGKISVIPIGFLPENDNYLRLTDTDFLRKCIKKRAYNAHKGDFGKALLIAGSKNMPGAAIIAARGALSGGTGLLTLSFPDIIYGALTTNLNECIFMPLKSDVGGALSQDNAEIIKDCCNNYTSIAFGCGAGVTKGTSEILKCLILNYGGTLIIDADGINALSANIDILKKAKGTVCITPHPGEMGRLINKSAAEVNADREDIAAGFASEYSVHVLLKGANTVIAAPDGRVFINPTGNPGMARGGCGDLLTGIAVSLASQNFGAFNALITAAYIHGLAGDIAAEKYGEYSCTVERITNCLPDAFLQISKGM